jgi:hypothetical protein
MAKRQDTRGFGDAETTSFPKMGDDYVTDHLVNISGQRSAYTMPVGKKSTTTDQGPLGGKATRSASLIHEANGPACTPIARISYPNSPEAKNVGRGMKTVPSSMGNRDFWGARGDNAGQCISDC